MLSDLPQDWRVFPPTPELAEIGSVWARSRELCQRKANQESSFADSPLSERVYHLSRLFNGPASDRPTEYVNAI